MTSHFSNLSATTFAVLVAGCMLSATAQSNDDNPFGLVPDHVTFAVGDTKTEAEWYEHALGFHETKYEHAAPDHEERTVSIGGYAVDLEWKQGSAKRSPPQSPVQQGYLHVNFRTSNIDAIYKRLTSLNIEIKKVVRNKTTNALFLLIVQDPEGNEIEIVNK